MENRCKSKTGSPDDEQLDSETSYDRLMSENQEFDDAKQRRGRTFASSKQNPLVILVTCLMVAMFFAQFALLIATLFEVTKFTGSRSGRGLSGALGDPPSVDDLISNGEVERSMYALIGRSRFMAQWFDQRYLPACFCMGNARACLDYLDAAWCTDAMSTGHVDACNSTHRIVKDDPVLMNDTIALYNDLKSGDLLVFMSRCYADISVTSHIAARLCSDQVLDGTCGKVAAQICRHTPRLHALCESLSSVYVSTELTIKNTNLYLSVSHSNA